MSTDHLSVRTKDQKKSEEKQNYRWFVHQLSQQIIIDYQHGLGTMPDMRDTAVGKTGKLKKFRVW